VSFSPWQLRTAAHVLRTGGVIAYPTEAVYGLGSDPRSVEAVQRLLELKKRPAHKGLILIAAGRDQLDPYVDWDALDEQRTHAVLSSWPGPITWLLPARRDVPVWLRGEHESIAVRVSAHAPVRELCLAYGAALVSTSANPTGRRPARSAIAVQRLFGSGVDLILHGPLGGLSKPTEIRDACSGEVVRPA
jgi:L-threonylcarbamoyladenylate synthase